MKNAPLNIQWVASLFALGLAFSPRPCAAEEPPRVGLSMGYPASVGVVWHVTDAVALRPELSFSHGATEATSDLSPFTLTSNTDSTVVGVGVSGLLYTAKWEALRSYVSPRFAYTRSSGSTTSTEAVPVIPGIPGTPALPPNPVLSTTISSYVISGSFGAEYSLARRFALFGEVGYGYTRTSSSSSNSASLKETANATGTRTGVGVIFYF